MATHVFDHSNLSQEIFAIDTWRAVICSLGHDHKHMLTILPTIWRPGFILYKTRRKYLEVDWLFILTEPGRWFCAREHLGKPA